MEDIQNPDRYYQQQYQAYATKTNARGKKGFALGLISTILLFPFFNPFMLWIVWTIAIFGLVYSIRGLGAAPRGFAVAGLILSAFPFVFHVIYRLFL